nr:pitrilysin family protein [uncultured Prevotella sp.]
MKYQTYTLTNGLRIILLHSDSQVIYCGYQVDAGARDEEPGKEGLAHFCEHVSFKGTKRRKAWNILNGLERVGGDLNAYTNKEDTTYYATILKEDVPKAVDLLTDMVFHSTFPQHELDKEKDVICEEIESYKDSPAELIYDEFENTIFHGHPLGHNILGTTDLVRSFKTEDALAFTGKYYRPDRTVFFAYGDVDLKKLVHLLERMFTIYPLERAFKADQGAGETTAVLSNSSNLTSDTNGNATRDKMNRALQGPEVGPHPPIVIQKQTHQSHVMVGCRAYCVSSPKRMPLYLLNNILGGPGMSAHLNVSLREHCGLVYTVESSMVCYGDTGLWCTYFGCDPKDINRCLRLMRKEFDKMITTPLTPAQLKAAKKQIKGQIGISCDNRENFALDFGKNFLHQNKETDIAELFRKIDAITAEQIQEVAQELLQKDRLTTMIFK